MERLTVDYGEDFRPFRYSMKDGSDAEIGYFKNYDAFYSHMLMVQKLGKYEDLEEQGLLLRLPCKNWMDIVFGKQETFFGIDKSYIENPIREITVDSADRFTLYDGWKTLVLNGADENGLDWEFSPEDIGKTVFLTKAEAVQKLKEMESD